MNGDDPNPRVAVTGIGIITSIGADVDSFWNSLLDGKSGIGPVTLFDPEGCTSKVASEVTDFDPSDYMDPKEARRNDRYTQFAVGAARLAVEDAALDLDQCDKSRVGVLVGSGIGGLGTIERQVGILLERGPRKVSPFMIPSLIANIAGGVIAIELGARGPNFGIVSACATGTHAIGESFRKMINGEADVMLAGGSEAAVTRIGFAGFCSMKAMSTSFNDEPSRASRPFDKNRDGFVMGEGAGVLVLEMMERAKARGARVYAELIGYSATCDAYHITSPDVEALALTECMNGALGDAGVATTEIDYVNAHGTSTQYNDKSETQAIKNVFGDHARDSLLISSTKSMTGHLLGAAGAIEAAACCKAIQTGMVPPTINYEDPDPDCDLDYVPNQARRHPINVAMNNNSGFGGHNGSLIFRKA